MTMNAAEARKVIVIGAGLGGIGAAVSLASAGLQVEVFEKNAHVGGKLNVLKRDGFSFDLGPSILTLPSVFEELFGRAGGQFEDYVEKETVKPNWRNFFEDGPVIDLYPSASETVGNSIGLGPDDEKDLAGFLEYSRQLYETFEPSYFRLGLDGVREMMRYHGAVPSRRMFDLLLSMDAGVRRRVHNRQLRMVLDFFVKYVGSSAFDAPACLILLPSVQAKSALGFVKADP